MAGQRGCDVLITIGDGGARDAFVTVAGIRARTISLSSCVIGGARSSRRRNLDQMANQATGSGFN